MALEILLPEYLKSKLDNMDTNLSAVVGALASKATDKLRVTVVDTLPRSPFTLFDSSGNELSGFIKNLDTALSVLYSLIRFGRATSPFWVVGSEVTAPASGTALVSKTVSTGKKGYVYGVFIMAGEANDFRLTWTSNSTSYSLRIPLCGRGAIMVASLIPLNEGLPADAGTTVSLTNINAGGSGVVYQSALLYAEV